MSPSFYSNRDPQFRRTPASPLREGRMKMADFLAERRDQYYKYSDFSARGSLERAEIKTMEKILSPTALRRPRFPYVRF